MTQLAFAVLVESRSIGIPFRHRRSVHDPTPSSLCRFAQAPRCDAGMLGACGTRLKRRTFMSGVWILLGLTVFGVIAMTIGWSDARARRSDLGFVSRRWLAEQHFD